MTNPSPPEPENFFAFRPCVWWPPLEVYGGLDTATPEAFSGLPVSTVLEDGFFAGRSEEFFQSGFPPKKEEFLFTFAWGPMSCEVRMKCTLAKWVFFSFVSFVVFFLKAQESA